MRATRVRHRRASIGPARRRWESTICCWWLTAPAPPGPRLRWTARRRFRPDAIVCTGFCGALEEKLDVASVVVATEVLGANGRFSARAPVNSLPHHLGVVLTIDHVAQSAAEKRSLRQTGAAAVDMEAAAVAGRSAALGLPFYCIKAATDLAGEDLANDLNAAMRPDGHFDTIRILGSIFCRPLVRLPELLRLRQSFRPGCACVGGFFCRLPVLNRTPYPQPCMPPCIAAKAWWRSRKSLRPKSGLARSSSGWKRAASATRT